MIIKSALELKDRLERVGIYEDTDNCRLLRGWGPQVGTNLRRSHEGAYLYFLNKGEGDALLSALEREGLQIQEAGEWVGVGDVGLQGALQSYNGAIPTTTSPSPSLQLETLGQNAHQNRRKSLTI